MHGSLEQQLAQSEQRALRYWYQDGLFELGLGVLFLLVGILFGMEARLPVDSGWRVFAVLALPVLTVGGVLLLRWVVRRLKEQITYPRTGYVAYRRPAKARWWRAAIAGAMGGLVAVLLATHPISLAWIPAIQGLLIGLVIYTLANRFNLGRFYLYAVASVLFGVGATWRVDEPAWGSAFYFAASGVVLIAGGGWVLNRYLRQTRPAVEQAHGG